MLIPNVVPVATYLYTGVATFSIPFSFYGTDTIKVYRKPDGEITTPLEPLTPNIDYTVAGVRAPDFDFIEGYTSGSVTLLDPGKAKFAQRELVVIQRETATEQLFEYSELDSFPAKSHENALGLLTVATQELADHLSRAVVIPSGSDQKTATVLADILAASVHSRIYAQGTDSEIAGIGGTGSSAKEYAAKSDAAYVAAQSQATLASQETYKAAQHAVISAQWAVAPVEELPNGSAKYWAERAKETVFGDLPGATTSQAGIVQLVNVIRGVGLASASLAPTEAAVAQAIQALANSISVATNHVPLPGSIIAFTGTFGGSDGKRPVFGNGVVNEHYALCDGTNGTPNLINRFILGNVSGHQVGGASTHGHTISGYTAAAATAVSGTIGYTALTIEQMPHHNHTLTFATGTASDGGYEPYSGIAMASGINLSYGTTYIQASGSGHGHTHSLTGLSAAAHSHSSAGLSVSGASNMPPYYTLAYVMYLGG